jgi:hypothetical protein
VYLRRFGWGCSDVELTASERAVLAAAIAMTGGTDTEAQRSLATRTARDRIEGARPLVVKTAVPNIEKIDKAAKVAARIEKLTEMSTSPSYSPAVNKLAGRQLALIKRGMSEEDACEIQHRDPAHPSSARPRNHSWTECWQKTCQRSKQQTNEKDTEMAPITSDMVVAGDGGKGRANKSSGPFDPGQAASLSPDAPGMPPTHGPEHSEVVADPGSTQDVPTFTAPTAPLDGSPASFTVIETTTVVGEVASGDAPTATGEHREADIAGTNGVDPDA